MLRASALRQDPVLVALRVIGLPAAALLLMLAARSLALLLEEPASFMGPVVIAAL